MMDGIGKLEGSGWYENRPRTLAAQEKRGGGTFRGETVLTFRYNGFFHHITRGFSLRSNYSSSFLLGLYILRANHGTTLPSLIRRPRPFMEKLDSWAWIRIFAASFTIPNDNSTFITSTNDNISQHLEYFGTNISTLRSDISIDARFTIVITILYFWGFFYGSNSPRFLFNSS